MSDPSLLADILTPDEAITVPFAPGTNITESMTLDVAEHFAGCAREDQRGYVLAAARIAEYSRVTLADALNTLVTVAVAYEQPGSSFADCKPGQVYLGPMESSYGTAIAPTAFIPFDKPECEEPELSRETAAAVFTAARDAGVQPGGFDA